MMSSYCATAVPYFNDVDLAYLLLTLTVSVCITFHALMYGVLALLDRHARVVASSRVISTSTARTY